MSDGSKGGPRDRRRTYAASGTPEDGAALYRELLRAGKITKEQLVQAAMLGYRAAWLTLEESDRPKKASFTIYWGQIDDFALPLALALFLRELPNLPFPIPRKASSEVCPQAKTAVVGPGTASTEPASCKCWETIQPLVEKLLKRGRAVAKSTTGPKLARYANCLEEITGIEICPWLKPLIEGVRYAFRNHNLGRLGAHFFMPFGLKIKPEVYLDADILAMGMNLNHLQQVVLKEIIPKVLAEDDPDC